MDSKYILVSFTQLQTTNFSNVVDLELLLDRLSRTFVEFRTHEQIENRLIMKRLKLKLNMLSINNTAVCNCHKVGLDISIASISVRLPLDLQAWHNGKCECELLHTCKRLQLNQPPYHWQSYQPATSRNTMTKKGSHPKQH